MHEIITLQLGQKSNYIATHFWNTQEAYFTYEEGDESLIDHDVHFRAGTAPDGTDTFTPRTLIYDLKSGFGSLRKVNALYEIEEPTAPQELWSVLHPNPRIGKVNSNRNGPTVVQREPVIQKNPYQQSLEQGSDLMPIVPDSVKYWSDFSRVFFHPKSIVQLNQLDVNPNLMPFETWDAGEELFSSIDKEHDILDRDLRTFIEEADQMQAIQIFASIDDAWGGFSAKYLDRIRDEYSKTTVAFWGSADELTSIPRDKLLIRGSNSARSTSEIASQASIFTPIVLPSETMPSYVTLGNASNWHKSALFSTALESMTLSSRLKFMNKSRMDFSELINCLNTNGRQNISMLQMSVHQSLMQIGSLNSSSPTETEISEQHTDMRLPSHSKHTEHSSVTNPLDLSKFDINFFPIQSSQKLRPEDSGEKNIFGQVEVHRLESEPTNKPDSGRGLDSQRARGAHGLSNIQKHTIPLPLPLTTSFPPIFPKAGPCLSLSTSLSTNTCIAEWLKKLQTIAKRAPSLDEREVLTNSLGEMAEAYEQGWDSGSDEDND
ncbi:unnamed protein product [Blumeria hordei]|uniref:Uncharacterized protein n=1 Tax=Blumeria hordei TaxID=2867405 RepID=A0A383UNS9_BLUHO|nr:unnamed protein product [Blumeria hordei]